MHHDKDDLRKELLKKRANEEVELVKHGYLIDLPKALDPSERPVKCSVCGTVTSLYHGYTPKYCSDCGAKFDNKEESKPVNEWIYADTIAGMRYYRCPNCDDFTVETLVDENEARWFRFCPRCGCKMFTKR